jgi:hypothetical protein
MSPFEQDGFADVVFPAELSGSFFAVDDLLDEFEFEFWSIFVPRMISPLVRVFLVPSGGVIGLKARGSCQTVIREVRESRVDGEQR